MTTDSPKGPEREARPEEVAQQDVASAQFVRHLVAGLDWTDVGQITTYARFLRSRKAA